jgi:hypothetical protein
MKEGDKEKENGGEKEVEQDGSTGIEKELVLEKKEIDDKDLIEVTNSNTNLKVIETVITISDPNVTTWSLSQQDCSELFYLCNGSSSSNPNPTSNSIPNPTLTTYSKRNPNLNPSSSSTNFDPLSNPDSHPNPGLGLGKTIVPAVSLVLEMKEPNPDTPDGMDKWLKWFDGLKTSIDLLTSHLVK